MFKNILSFTRGYKIINICIKSLVFHPRLYKSSIKPINEITTAHIPIVIKSWSALPKKIVDTKKANEVAIPPKGGMSLLLSLFSLVKTFFL